MPQTQIACPRCRQLIPAMVEQLFDVTADPQSKQRLLGGVSNRARCSFCGYEGNLATPVVYHDADKELLFTFFPSELGIPVNEQEKLIGPLISQVMNRLPAEKRKAYLLRPQGFLTYESLLERILAADGITKEMLNEQQKRLDLIQRLLKASSPVVRSEMIKENQTLFDEAFFALLSRLFESAIASGQQPVSKALNDVQQQLLAETELGKRLKSQVAEVEAAVKTLQEAGKELTREKLLEIFIAAPSDERLKALVSMTRNGLDYTFFQMLTERIDKSSGEEKTRLESLRSKVLDYVNEIDKQIADQLKQAQAFIEQLLAQPDITKAAQENLDMFNELTMQVLEAMYREAQQKNDQDRQNKIQQVIGVLQQASTPPQELGVIERLLKYDEKEFEKAINEHEQEITPQFMEMLGGLAMQMSQQPKEAASEDDKVMMNKVQSLYNTALKWEMKKNLK
jgi:predicted Zn-dependent protease with MMP-like domain